MASYESEHRMSEENLELGLLRLIIRSGWSDEISATFDSLFPDGAKPAHPEAVAELSVYKCLELKDQKGQCLICLEPWEDADERETATKMPCTHLFHTKCIKLWFEKTNSCPCCRHELRSTNEDYEEYKRIQKRKTERQADLDELHNSMFS